MIKLILPLFHIYMFIPSILAYILRYLYDWKRFFCASLHMINSMAATKMLLMKRE